MSTASKGMPKLSGGQTAVLILACVPMVAAGAAGGWGTYTNVVAEFKRSATALGVVAGGEGVTLVLALVMVGLTMLGQSAPAPVRLGMWGAPLAAAVTGVAVADDATEAVVYAMTPMAMSASAEGLGLLARRIVVFRTGVDMEARRRNAETVQRLNYHRARAANHPTKWVRERSEKASWRLAKRVGVGDEQLGASLVEVQRTRIREGADAALVDMFGVTPAVPELPAVVAEVSTEQAVIEAPKVDSAPLPTLDTPPAVEVEAAPVEPEPELQVICGAGQVHTPPMPEDEAGDEVDTDTPPEVDSGESPRLSTENAKNVIRVCWVMGDSIGDAARKATRSRSYVQRVYARLDEMQGKQPAPERLALVRSEATA
ncbi:MAG: hypothetical protein ACRDP3_04015 [Streptomyces sp.]|uniref:hypothetical protein n=1 Tax=Streptomyces sp. TaxID=1931 RepID=UPI003D6C0FB3